MRLLTVTRRRAGGGSEDTLAELRLQPDASRPGVSALRETLVVPDTEGLRIEASTLEANGNTSLAVFEGQRQLLLATLRWDASDPYLGVTLLDGTVLHIYFSKTW